ncbi:SOS response-associated peptidase [Ramlibacter sp.]|uniref:SOS response-associated peptidase n=1 Tax=Ramlibacter sp. TaxID=1917967 RepID=UPI0035B067DF
MCSNYQPVTRGDRMLAFFGVERDFTREVPPEAYPLHVAPFIRLAEPGSGNKVMAGLGQFGLLPPFATEVAYGRRTYNARSETVHSKPSFRQAWRRGQRCIVPAEAVYEPRYNDDLTVERWIVQQPGAVPMGIAGIYDCWKGPDGRDLYSFAMLTVNADGHPVYGQFHEPGEEKRMVAILDPRDYEAWLTCPVADAMRYVKAWTGPLEAFARPRPPRAPRAASGQTVVPRRKPQPPENGQLF